MIGRVIAHYEIIDKLGAGGMGVVYKARDRRLDRFVALKLLTDGRQEGEYRARFLQEARAASSLDHPNICTVYDAGEADSELYIVMAYYEGETVARRLDRGPLPHREAVEIAAQTAEGLARAHEAGIIHRDIKPGNILITTHGLVKILDFGLAKLAGADTLTKPQILVGTPAYMSPEQIRGEVLDHRTDLWSLGVVLYEMLTGRRAFAGENAHSLSFAILEHEPPPPHELTPALPEFLDGVVAKALAKDRQDRYALASDFARDLRQQHAVDEDARTEHLERPHITPSVGVLPFVDMSPQKDQEYFCDGIAEELINALSKVKDLRVAARTSSFQFKGTAADVRTVARKLNVSTVLEGSVRKAGNKIRVSAQLINASDGFPLWADRFDRPIDDIFAIQDEIAQSIVSALQITLSDAEKKAIEKQPTVDVLAYEHYLRGRSFLYRFRRKHFEYARQMFSRAIEIDPQYALGYAGLADCSSLLYMFWEATEENLRRADETSERALELAPDLAEAHVSRAVAVSLRGRFDEAQRDFETAIRLNPRSFEAYYFYARMSLVEGHLQRSADLFEQASRLRPDDYQSPLLAGPIYISLGQRKKAEEMFRRGLDIAARHLEHAPDDARALYLGAAGWIELGELEKGREWIRRSLDVDPDDPATLFNAACRYASLDDTEQALTALEHAVANGYAYREWIEHDPDLDRIRDHPRYQAVIDRLR